MWFGSSAMLRELLDDLRRHDSLFWRRAMHAGVTYGPDALVRYSPPVFGLACAAVLPAQRRAVRRNLRLALGPRSAALEAIDVARVFANYGSCLTDAFIAGSDRGDQVKTHCIHDDYLADAITEGHGVVLATAHTGGWQIAGPALRAIHTAELLVVMRRERDRGAQELQSSVRDRAGIRVIYVGDDPLEALGLLAHLRGGGLVAMQMDRLPQGMRGRKSELFGAPWPVPEGPLRLAAMSRAPIVPVFALRTGYMEYEVHVAPPIRLPRRPSDADLDRAAREVLREMEKFVRANPTQWFHFE
jgi:phosphatidylinositol dimannoside acyltransferase